MYFFAGAAEPIHLPASHALDRDAPHLITITASNQVLQCCEVKITNMCWAHHHIFIPHRQVTHPHPC